MWQRVIDYYIVDRGREEEEANPIPGSPARVLVESVLLYEVRVSSRNEVSQNFTT